MEHGSNKDEITGELISAHYIQELVVEHEGKVIVNTQMAGGISKNPYFAFMLKGGEKGDKITIRWKDNLGNTDSEDRLIN